MTATLQPSPKVKSLSPKQLNFSNLVISGKTQAQSYITAYDKPNNYDIKLARAAGQKIYNSRLVQEYIKSQTRKAERKTGLTLAQRFEILAQIATDENNSPDTRIRCIDVYNKMTGENGSHKIEINGVFTNNPSKQLTVRDKIEYLRKARELRKVNETVNDEREPVKTDNSSNGKKTGDPLSPAPSLNEQASHLPLIEIESHQIT
jgi:hypothetical protein